MAVPVLYRADERRQYLAETERYVMLPDPIPEGAMRVAPGSDALVWRINPDKCGEL